MDPKQSVGAHMKAARKRAKLRQEDVAKHVGVHPVTVSEWETGAQMPDEATRAKLAALYRVSLGELCYGSDLDAFRRGVEAAAVALHHMAASVTDLPLPETRFEESENEDVPDPTAGATRRRKAR